MYLQLIPSYYGKKVAVIFAVLFQKLIILANVNVNVIAVARPSVCRLSSVTLVHPTQTVEIFGNISTAFDTLAIP